MQQYGGSGRGEVSAWRRCPYSHKCGEEESSELLVWALWVPRWAVLSGHAPWRVPPRGPLATEPPSLGGVVLRPTALSRSPLRAACSKRLELVKVGLLSLALSYQRLWEDHTRLGILFSGVRGRGGPGISGAKRRDTAIRLVGWLRKPTWS